jgi:sulfite exporter TauE/SafE/copper chaperone CopZ
MEKVIGMQKAPAEARLRVKGMTCAHCQQKIERGLMALPGVESAKASFSKGTARILYDPAMVGMKDFETAVRGAGYSVGTQTDGMPLARAAGFVSAILVAYLLLSKVSGGALAGILPLAQAGMGYGMLFVIGLITSVHCAVMCGGINMSQCIGAAGKQMSGGGKGALKPSLLYNLGRVVSYTAVGALVGALGSVVSFTGAMKGAVQAAAGVFMVIMGLSMTGLFPWLSRLVPRMPSGVAQKLNRRKGSAGPFYVGLINGLMPCGPLQAMQLYALSTGSALAGATSMLVFSLGTVPLMFALGAASSLLSRRFTKRAMAVGAVLVAALGLTMLTGGLNLAGVRLSPGDVAATTAIAEQTTESQGVQQVRTTLASGRYEPITVTAGTPVEWTIDAPQGSINGCNGRMVIPAFNIEHAFTEGENVIKFTPEKAGVYPYSCWMGMITSTITVVEPGESAVTTPAANGSSPDAAATEAPAVTQGSCCAGGAAYGTPDSTGAASSLGSCCGSAEFSGSTDDSADGSTTPGY